MASLRDPLRTPTKKSGTTSATATPRSTRPSGAQRSAMEDDLPLPPSGFSGLEDPNLDAYFAPLPPSRAASIYSVNRATLSGQLSQLTSTDLPDADSLAAKITALPTALAAAKALTNSAKQIKSWIRTAADVLGGLDAQDDVEWAGSGSRDGVNDVDIAIKKFEKLVATYIAAVEEARKRPDYPSMPKLEITVFLDTLDEVVAAWEKVKKSLQRVKTQNELAMEWEDLWNSTLGEIGQEIEELSTLVFELEEKRYAGEIEEAGQENASGIDVSDLSTIVEESSTQKDSASRGPKAVSIPAGSPLPSPGLEGPTEDTGLLRLFARMQPLRASLDFLPMKLNTYEAKAKNTFPSACAELQARRQTLEKKYDTLQSDAEILRRELGEDKWVVVFRNASRQAQKMCDSVDKSIQKLREVLKDETRASNAPLLAKKISDYEAKRSNYGPAIQKVLNMIEKGVKDRATVNGEILRIHEDTRQMWTKLEKRIQDTNGFLEEANATRNQQLRDSISTILSTDMSGIASAVETPESSLASSPAIGPADKASFPTTPDSNLPRSRNSSSVRSLSASRPIASRRVLSQPPAASTTSTKRHTSLASAMSRLSTASPSPGPRPTSTMPTIPSSRTVTPGTATNKPRWSVGSAVDRKLLESKPGFTPTAYAQRLKNAKPSVYSYRSASGSTTSSALPSPSPLGRSTPSNSRYSTGQTIARAASSLGHHPQRNISPTPSYDRASNTSLDGENMPGRPRSRLYRPSLPSVSVSNTPASNRIPSISTRQNAASRRTSMLPLPASPSLPSLTLGEDDVVIRTSMDSIEDDIIPSIEDDISSPTVAAKQRRLPIRPASSLAGSMGPYVAHNKTSLLRAGSAVPGAATAKPKWR